MDMYNLKEAWTIMQETEPFQGWDGKVYCTRTDAAVTFRANRTRGFMSAYSFTLVLEGWLVILYNETELTLKTGDLYIYSPGMGITILSASDDYHGICLLADESLSLETDAVRDMVRLAYLPVIRLHEPRIPLAPKAAQALRKRMEEITEYLHSDNTNKKVITRHLYAVFLLDLQNVLEGPTVETNVPKRTEEIFIGFIRLLPEHFIEHRDIGFYANALNISPTYLSRIVRQTAGRTVVDYINQFLLMEAAFLLQTTSLNISQISDRLHFSDQAAFSKFFTRLQGTSPKKYRLG